MYKFYGENEKANREQEIIIHEQFATMIFYTSRIKINSDREIFTVNS